MLKWSGGVEMIMGAVGVGVLCGGVMWSVVVTYGGVEAVEALY